MAIYYKWIKGCASGANLQDGAWTYLTWGNEITDTISSLPKLEISCGKMGNERTYYDLGYIPTSKASNIVIEKKWDFSGGIAVDSITSHGVNKSLSISQPIELQGAIVSSSGATFGSSLSATSLNISGSASVQSLQASGSISAVGTITTNASLKADADCEALWFNATSDKRAKENIKPATYCALDLINKLTVYVYNYKNNPKETVTGIMAQDLLETQPNNIHLVSNIQATGENGDYMSIKNDKLMFILLKAIQEQQEEINNLKKEIDNLKNSK